MEAAAVQSEHVISVTHRCELIQKIFRKLLDLCVLENDVGIIMATDMSRRPAAAGREEFLFAKHAVERRFRRDVRSLICKTRH